MPPKSKNVYSKGSMSRRKENQITGTGGAHNLKNPLCSELTPRVPASRLSPIQHRTAESHSSSAVPSQQIVTAKKFPFVIPHAPNIANETHRSLAIRHVHNLNTTAPAIPAARNSGRASSRGLDDNLENASCQIIHIPRDKRSVSARSHSESNPSSEHAPTASCIPTDSKRSTCIFLSRDRSQAASIFAANATLFNANDCLRTEMGLVPGETLPEYLAKVYHSHNVSNNLNTNLDSTLLSTRSGGQLLDTLSATRYNTTFNSTARTAFTNTLNSTLSLGKTLGSNSSPSKKGGGPPETRIRQDEGPLYVVGSAVLNPYTPVAPPVQLNLREVTTLAPRAENVSRVPQISLNGNAANSNASNAPSSSAGGGVKSSRSAKGLQVVPSTMSPVGDASNPLNKYVGQAFASLLSPGRPEDETGRRSSRFTESGNSVDGDRRNSYSSTFGTDRPGASMTTYTTNHACKGALDNLDYIIDTRETIKSSASASMTSATGFVPVQSPTVEYHPIGLNFGESVNTLPKSPRDDADEDRFQNNRGPRCVSVDVVSDGVNFQSRVKTNNKDVSSCASGGPQKGPMRGQNGAKVGVNASSDNAAANKQTSLVNEEFPFFYVEDIPSDIQPSRRRIGPASVAEGVQDLKRIYHTTDADVLKGFSAAQSQRSLLVQDVLPELAYSKERAQQWSIARRHVDWNIAELPTHETLQPPSIVYFDKFNKPVPQTSHIDFLLDSTTRVLKRASATMKERLSITSNANGDPMLHIGDAIEFDETKCKYRIKHLVGLMAGLAEKVGLERVMEYNVDVPETARELFTTKPRVDSVTGDLIIYANGTVEGTCTLKITGYDCASIDPHTETVLKSTNELLCTVVVHRGECSSTVSPQARAEELPIDILKLSPRPISNLLATINTPPKTEIWSSSVPHPPQTGSLALANFLSPTTIRDTNEVPSRVRQVSISADLTTEQQKSTDSPLEFIFPATNLHDLRYDEYKKDQRTCFANVLEGGPIEAKNSLTENPELARRPTSQGRDSNAKPSNRIVSEKNHPHDPASTNCNRVTPALQFDMESDIMPADCWYLRSVLSRIRGYAWQEKVKHMMNCDVEFFDPLNRHNYRRKAREECASLFSLLDSIKKKQLLNQTAKAPTARSRFASNGGLGDIDPLAISKITSEKTITTIRRYIFTLLLEEDRSSPQLYMDVVEMANRLCTASLVCAISVTGGNKTSLQELAAAVLSDGAPLDTDRTQSFNDFQDTLNFSEKDRKSLQTLSDSLEIAMTAFFVIGAYREAVECALQRVHSLCILESDTTPVVCAAQRDLGELCFLYGDFSTALSIADDIVMLAEQLSRSAIPCSVTMVNAECFIYLCALFAGNTEKCNHYKAILRKRWTQNDSENSGNKLEPIELTEVGLTLVHAESEPFLSDAVTSNLSASPNKELFNILRDCIGLLKMVGEQLSSEANSRSSSGSIAGAKIAPEKEVTKRQYWSLLVWCGNLLIRYGDEQQGMEILERILADTVLAGKTSFEKLFNSHDAAATWVEVTMWKVREGGSERAENLIALKRVVANLSRIRGRHHPLALAANMMLVEALLPDSPKLAVKSVEANLSLIANSLSSKSPHVFWAYLLSCKAYTAVGQWKPALRCANGAMIIAQNSKARDSLVLRCEKHLLGCLLRCPPGTAVKLNTEVMLQMLQERAGRMERAVSTNSQYNFNFVESLQNLAEGHYLMYEFDSALSAMERALQEADPKGMLFLTSDLLKPGAQLIYEFNAQRKGSDSGEERVNKRNELIHSLVPLQSQVWHIAQILYAMGSILEALGRLNDAQDAYGRSLSLLEATQVSHCLSAIRIFSSIAKLQYTANHFGDALGWAIKAQSCIYSNYRDNLHEKEAADDLVKIVKFKLEEVEGTWVAINRSGPNRLFVELL